MAAVEAPPQTPGATADTGQGQPDPRALAVAQEIQNQLQEAEAIHFGSRATGVCGPAAVAVPVRTAAPGRHRGGVEAGPSGPRTARLPGFVNGLKAHAVQFASASEQMDTSNPMGWLVFPIFGALAEFERDRIREPRWPAS